MLIADDIGNVHRMKMGRELDHKVLYWVAAWLSDGLLYDTGCSYTARELADHLQGRGVKVAVNSHHHEDHIGANKLLQQELGVKIYASALAAALISQKPKLLPYQELVWGYPDLSEVEIIGDSIEVNGRSYQVIETPGHCPGHIVLFDEQNHRMFMGDLFVTETPRAIRPNENVGKMIKDMRKLAALGRGPLTLFTALGDAFEDGRGALLRCADYLENIVAQSKKLLSQGLTPDQIRDQIFKRESGLASITDGDFSIKNLVKSAIEAE